MSKYILSFVISLLMSASLLADPVPSDVVTPTDGQQAVAAKPVDLEIRETPVLGKDVEKQLPLDGEFAQDVSALTSGGGDRVETRKVLEKGVKTIKLHNVVPPILFGSGEANIPEEYIEKVRKILEGMKDRKNVRLHLVGYTDNVKLRGAAKAKYGDNAGLSRERAGVAAEFFQSALKLPPESISYEGMGESQPVASNATKAGKRLNRRMEVEVWYDEPDDKMVEKQVVVSDAMKRIKVCRVEQVCKLSYKAGIAKRARIRNLIAPLHFDDSFDGHTG